MTPDTNTVEPERSTILVPIRYPIGEQSTRTLLEAGRLAEEHAPATLVALHVDLVQYDDATRTRELASEVATVLDGVEAAVVTRRGFLLEEVILEEAEQLDADVVVLGANGQSRFRRLLRRLVGNDPDVGSFLREHAAAGTDVVEVGSRDESPAADDAAVTAE